MILVKLYGGLGNQMFQYAAARSLSLRLDLPVYYDDEYFLNPERFGSQWPFALDHFKTFIGAYQPGLPKKIHNLVHRLYRKLNTWGLKSSSHFFEKANRYNPNFKNIQNATVVDGYFQSYRYFEDIRKNLINEFKPLRSLDEKNQQTLQEMQSSQSISLHVRRGDYVSNNQASLVHGLCDLNYYQRAIQFFEAKLDKPVFYIFSDDLNWARENLKIKSKSVLVDHNQDKNYLDLYLMTQCHHNIIANSSFSWWGAWLNDHSEKIVIAPQKWFLNQEASPDLCPPDWIRF